MLVFVLIAAVLLLILFLLAPSFRRRQMRPWAKTAFAHRGLHGNGVCENTLAAFEKACQAGFGIELDVQLSRDGCVMVFHDDTLQRMLGDPRRVDAADRAELQAMVLEDGNGIPTFEEVLSLVDGRVPLLVEIKNGRRNSELCQKTLALLQNYEGRYVVESFSPLIVQWLRKHAPQVFRGQLVGSMKSYMPSFGKPVAFLLSMTALNFLARPDFVAYDVSARFAAPLIHRFLFHTPLACWTVKDPDCHARALSRGEMPIFEGFLPPKD